MLAIFQSRAGGLHFDWLWALPWDVSLGLYRNANGMVAMQVLPVLWGRNLWQSAGHVGEGTWKHLQWHRLFQ